MPSGAGLLPPILFESAHKMDANQPAPLTPVAPFSGRNISSSYATFAPAATLSATPPPAPTPSPVPATEPTTAAHPTPTPAPVTTSDALRVRQESDPEYDKRYAFIAHLPYRIFALLLVSYYELPSADDA